jgi:hypothetical protein
MFVHKDSLDGFHSSLGHIDQAREQLLRGNQEGAWKCAGAAQHEAARLPFLLRRRVIETIYDLPWPDGTRSS